MKKTAGRGSRFFGTRVFYKKTLGIMVPIMVQSLITNFVNLLDNIMCGQVGTEQFSGVAIANQLVFIYNLAIFGALSGIGIFTAQYFGKQDQEGARYTIRAKIEISALIFLIFLAVCLTLGPQILGLYMQAGDQASKVAATLSASRSYLNILLAGLFPFAMSQVYATTLKESGKPVLPMAAGISAMLVNLVGNYILIFGHFGAPAMGVAGAAVATVISRYVEMAVVMIGTHVHADENPFACGLYRSPYIPASLIRQMVRKGTPLLINEILWSIALSAIAQSYSTRGLDAVAAQNITSTVYNLFSQVYFSTGVAISIIVGQLLGAGKLEEAKETDTKLIVFGLLISSAVALIGFLLSPLFPDIYKTPEAVRSLAASMLRVICLCMPLACFVHCCYFTLRSGGKTIITFIFDSLFCMAVSFPVSFILSRYTDISMLGLFTTIQLLDLIKAVIGFIMVKKGIWIHNIVGGKEVVS